MPISMAYPVLAAIGAVVLLHETLGGLAALGVALTLGGVYLVAARPLTVEEAPRARQESRRNRSAANADRLPATR